MMWCVHPPNTEIDTETWDLASVSVSVSVTES